MEHSVREVTPYYVSSMIAGLGTQDITILLSLLLVTDTQFESVVPVRPHGADDSNIII
jgi:hypothetical protein